MGLWTGCIAGALPESVCRDQLAAAGFAAVDIEPTMVYRRDELEQMAAQMEPSLLPDGLDTQATIDALDGAVMSAFIRARKPE